MVADAARVAHAGGGDDDLGGGVHVQHLGLLAGLRHAQVGEVEHVGAVLHQLQRRLIQIAPQVAGEDGGGLLGQGGVDVHGEVRVALHHPLVLDLPDEVQQLLGAAHGEGGDHHVAALGDGLVDDLRQIVGVAPHLRVVAVAVGGLHHHVVRAGEVGGVPDDGLVHIADVAGKDDLFGDAALRGGDEDGGGAQQMARVHELHPDALAQVQGLVVLAGGHVLAHPLGVLDGVKGLHPGGAGPLRLAVLPLRVGLLDVGGVLEHDVHEIRRQPGGDDPALEALLHQHGDPAGVVDVGVGHQDEVDVVRGKGKSVVGHLVPPLLQSAVHQDAPAVDLQTVAAAGDALVGAVKAELHGGTSFFAPPRRGGGWGFFVSLTQRSGRGKGRRGFRRIL